MSNEDQMKVDWIRFLDLKRRCFSDLNIFNWHKKLMWRNEFEAHEYPTFELLKGGIIGLTNLFCHLADMYCYGVSAEIIAKEYEDQGQGPFGFWRYRIRNYHIYDLIPKYYSFRDHAAYFVASLTKWEVKDAELEKENKCTTETSGRFLENPSQIQTPSGTCRGMTENAFSTF